MKITPTSAMRARDVSRPRAEQLAAAAEREEAVTRHGRGSPDAAKPSTASPGTASPGSVPLSKAPPSEAPLSAVGQAGVTSPAAPPAAAKPGSGGEPTAARAQLRRRER